MELNRSLIKSQAKELIKGNVLKLFLISIIVLALTGAVSTVYQVGDTAKNEISDNIVPYYNDGNNNNFGDYDFPFSDDFGNNGNSNSNSNGNSNSNPLDDFTGNIQLLNVNNTSQKASVYPYVSSGARSSISSIASLIALFTAPLLVTLMGLYVLIVRGKKFTVENCFEYVFSNAFNKFYWHKFVLELVKNIIIALMTMLLIIPGIIFNYRYYFAEMIMSDKPELSGTQALKLSIKMTKGHKGELFLLDLSFIGWFILTGITFGIVGIYVIPYYTTVKALYYENFRMRAFSEGALTSADFETFDQQTANNNQYGNSEYQQQSTTYYQPPTQNTDYYNQQTSYYNNNFGDENNNINDSQNNDFNSQSDDFNNNQY